MLWLVDQLGITHTQAHHLIRSYEREQRTRMARLEAEASSPALMARAATREEFSAWFNRRGDVIHARLKIKRGWAVSSDGAA